MANRYIASVRKIKTMADYGWAEKIVQGQPSIFSLNGYQAQYDYHFSKFFVIAPDGSIRTFDIHERQYMTDYANQKKED